jgi:GT2 family glycosyltransferase
MIIGGKEYTINILILFMEHEIDVTIAMVETLMDSIEDGVIISILLNGGARRDLPEMFSASPYIRYYESPNNLGVAGGRNFLLDTEEAAASDIIMFVDNDVIPTSDYVKSLATFLINHKDAGIVGATLLNIDPFIRCHRDCFKEKKGFFGGDILSISNRSIKRLLRKYFQTSKFYHLGVHEDWYNVYFSSHEQYENVLDELGIRRKKFFAHNKSMKARSFSFFNNRTKELPASNIGGGAQAFRRSLIDEIGKLNDLFSPFGYEDVDFCIRAIKKGYKNYVDVNTFLLHGTDYRQERRDKYDSSGKYTNEYRCLTILSYIHFPDTFHDLMQRRILYDYMEKHLTEPRNADEYLYYSIEGYRQGKKQISRQILS